MPQCTASAPGKVLVAGGYLVLIRPNVGIVVGMSARFTSTVKGLPCNATAHTTMRIHSFYVSDLPPPSPPPPSSVAHVSVSSPQLSDTRSYVAAAAAAAASPPPTPPPLPSQPHFHPPPPLFPLFFMSVPSPSDNAAELKPHSHHAFNQLRLRRRHLPAPTHLAADPQPLC